MLRATSGVKEASVNFANLTAMVEYDPSIAKPVDLQSAVRSIGYDLVVNVEDPQAIKEESQRKHYEDVKRETIWSSILSVPVLIMGMFYMYVLEAMFLLCL